MLDIEFQQELTFADEYSGILSEWRSSEILIIIDLRERAIAFVTCLMFKKIAKTLDEPLFSKAV
jgi:hypothetical protein